MGFEIPGSCTAREMGKARLSILCGAWVGLGLGGGGPWRRLSSHEPPLGCGPSLNHLDVLPVTPFLLKSLVDLLEPG
jgi:hypothetical protein